MLCLRQRPPSTFFLHTFHRFIFAPNLYIPVFDALPLFETSNFSTVAMGFVRSHTFFCCVRPFECGGCIPRKLTSSVAAGSAGSVCHVHALLAWKRLRRCR
jgi:hypothetical protein